MNNIGDKLKSIRKAKGYSLDELAKISYVSKSYIWELENSIDCNPTIKQLWKLAKALDIPIAMLTGSQQEISKSILKDHFFSKFNMLNDRDKIRIENIIDSWLKECDD